MNGMHYCPYITYTILNCTSFEELINVQYDLTSANEKGGKIAFKSYGRDLKI